jgi:FdhD protein
VLFQGPFITPVQINELVVRLFQSQELYRKTGGVHTSILSNGENTLIKAEDIGRHNTIDKIAGAMLKLEAVLPYKILITTGRISSEMLQKAARMQAEILISRTSPSSLSIQLAEQMGITLIGYARRNQFNVYAHPERIIN